MLECFAAARRRRALQSSVYGVAEDISESCFLIIMSIKKRDIIAASRPPILSHSEKGATLCPQLYP
jgi:hypothetical protein